MKTPLFTRYSDPRLTETFTARVVEWNRSRGLSTLDLKLEGAMLLEEVQELLMAKTLVDKLDAVADILFVLEGTSYKTEASGEEHCPEWYRHALAVSREVVEDTFSGVDIFGQPAEQVFKAVAMIVLEANERKGTDTDENGKLLKGPDYVKPEPKILQMLNELSEAYIGDLI